MAKTPMFDPGTSEVRSPLLAGLTEGVSKLSDILNIETTSTTITLQNVKISVDDKNRIYQASANNKLWLESPAPIIRKNGNVITPENDNFVIDYVGGSIAFEKVARLEDGDVVTAEVTYCTNQSKVIKDIISTLNELKAKNPVLISYVLSKSMWENKTATIHDSNIISDKKYIYVLGLSSETVEIYKGGAIWADDVTESGEMVVHTKSDQKNDINFEIIRLEVDDNSSYDLGSKVISQILGGGDSAGLYAFEINDKGHLMLGYEGDEPPAFSIEDDGHLYYDVPPKLDLGKVVSEVHPLDFYAYDGVDLTVKFASEISEYDDVWAWLKARLTAQDIKDLHVKDYVPLVVKDNIGNDVTLQMQIADINHDLGFMDSEITKYHIDFISKNLWPTAHVWNKVSYNNGVNDETCPWLCSDLYAWLNSKEMQVPNETTVNPTMEDVDYTTSGVLDKLPASLQSIIAERRDYVPQRYSNNGPLTDDNNWGPWKYFGKLWVPNETEVYSQIVFGTQNGYSVGTTHQFPIFMDGRTRIKHLGAGGARCAWWLRSVRSGSSTAAAAVGSSGYAFINSASVANTGAPVCFRISG